MKLSHSVKPISYFKSHASEIIKNFSENQDTIIITQNGEAKAVVQDIRTYEKTQESLAMLKLLAMSRRSVEKGRCRTAEEVFKDLEAQVGKDFPE